jgi:hypothetical protein
MASLDPNVTATTRDFIYNLNQGLKTDYRVRRGGAVEALTCKDVWQQQLTPAAVNLWVPGKRRSSASTA